LIAAFAIIMQAISMNAARIPCDIPSIRPAGPFLVALTGLISTMSLYSSAISVSEDVRLRKSIRKVARESHHMLSKVGTVRIDQELQNRVLAIAREQSDRAAEETGVCSSMMDEDMKKYLDEACQNCRKMQTAATATVVTRITSQQPSRCS
jgi:hypothetical protein